MKAGLKYYDNDGNQISVYPSIAVHITQNPLGAYSHAGAKSTDQAYTPNYKLYAPVDLVCVKNNGATGGGATFYHTVNPVVTPSGLKHYTLALTHDNNATQWIVGKTYPQGTHIYTEGTAGQVTGRHVHIDVAEGHVTTQYQNPQGVWDLVNSVYLDEIMFVDETIMSQANQPGATDYIFNWQTHGGGGGVTPSPKDKKITLVFGHMVKEMEVVKVGDIYKVVKKTKDTLELELIKDTKPVTPTKEYVIIDKNVTTYTVHPIGQKPTDFNVKAKLAPIKFGGLEYQVLGKPYANTVTIQTRDYGKVNLPLTKYTRIIKK